MILVPYVHLVHNGEAGMEPTEISFEQAFYNMRRRESENTFFPQEVLPSNAPVGFPFRNQGFRPDC